MSTVLPLLYTDLADWFQLLTAPEEYAEEASFYMRCVIDAAGQLPDTLLELGAGAGNNASHYKKQARLATLVDLSPGMLALSRTLNPECEHYEADMRHVRLGREFDAVFIHDAIEYMTTLDDLRQVIETAHVHCRPGGVTLFAPDQVKETFRETADAGGNDGQGRALRYLEWTFDPDPSDTTYVAEYVYLLHEDGKPTRSVYDRHLCGVFSRADWLRLLEEIGFEARVLPFEHSEVEGELEVFVCLKPAG